MTEAYRWEANSEAGLKFELPTSWQVVRTDGATLVAQPAEADSGIGIDFAFITQGAPEAAVTEKAFLEHLKKLVDDASITNPLKPIQQHGIDGFGVGGLGHRAGRTIEWFSINLGNHRGHGILAFGHAPQDRFAAYRDAIVRIINSIQPLD